MKKFFVFLMMAFAAITTVQAQTIAIAGAKNGGEIRLMANKAKCQDGSRLIVIAKPGGNYMAGCWALMEDKVFAVFDDGDKMLYDIGGFTLVPEKPVKQKGNL